MTKAASRLFLIFTLVALAPLGSKTALGLDLHLRTDKPLKALEEALSGSEKNISNTEESSRGERKEAVAKAREMAQEKRQEKREEVRDNICEKIGDSLDKRAGKLAEAKIGSQEERLEKLAAKRAEQDAKLAKERAEADSRRAAMYAKLLEKADTDAEKAAVEAFKDTVENVVKARREAVDAAISAYRAGVDEALADKKEVNGASADAFREKVSQALAEAKKDCDAGVDAGTVRSEFQASVNVAKEELKDDRQSAEETAKILKELGETRKEAIQKAFETFQSELSAAKAALKLAFGEESV